MAGGNAIERAEQSSRKRTRILWMESLMFVIWQGGFMLRLRPQHEPLRLVDRVGPAAMLVWALVLLALLATGGAFFTSPEVRRLMNDDVSTANRHEGQRWGFWAAMITVVGVYGIGQVEPLTLNTAVHLVLTMGIGAALGRFAFLERRADSAG